MKIDLSMLQANHLDEIRVQKVMTVEDLCDGICTDRQYRRYLSGDSILSYGQLVKFCDKLNIGINDFYYSLGQKDRYTFKQLEEVYQLIYAKKFDESYESLKAIDKTILDSSNTRFYNYILLRLKFEKHIFNENDVMKEIHENNIYDNLKKSNIYDFVDILYLNLISNIELRNEHSDAFEILIKILRSDEDIYISTENKFLLPPIYSNLSQQLGQKKRYAESFELAQDGIAFCLKHSSSDALRKLYYIEMLGYQKQHNEREMYKSAVKCISACLSTKISDLAPYRRFITEEIGIDPFELFMHVKDDFNE